MIQQPENKAPCCGFAIHDENPTIKWNPYNGVVMCHACGEIYVPHQTAKYAVTSLVNQAFEISYEDGIDIWAPYTVKAMEFAKMPPPIYACSLCGKEDAHTANGSDVCADCDKEYPHD